MNTSKCKNYYNYIDFNFIRCRMRLVSPNGFKIDFVWNQISGSAAYFSVIILKFILKQFLKLDFKQWHQNNFYESLDRSGRIINFGMILDVPEQESAFGPPEPSWAQRNPARPGSGPPDPTADPCSRIPKDQ